MPQRRPAGRASKQVRTGDDEAGASSKKERDPNWSKSEILCLIELKRQEYIDEMTVKDARELMCPELGKWGKIALKLNAAKGEGDVERGGEACKYKWNTLLSDFKKIWDFHCRTGRNSEEYFTDTTKEEKALHKLPKSFYAVAYRSMSEWLRNKATLNPPHARDTMDPNDHNYQAPIRDDASQGLGFMDNMGEQGWQGVRGPLPSPHIDLTCGDSPQVSSAASQRVNFGRGLGAGAPSPPLHTASTADLGRHGNNPPSPRPGHQEINLNAPPRVGGPRRE